MAEIYSYYSEDAHSNTYLIVDSDTGEAAVIDPSQPPSVFDVDFSKINLKYILLTHGHFDHMFKLEKYRRDFGAKVLIHELDEELLYDGEKNCSALFMYDRLILQKADMTFGEKDKILLGNTEIRILHTPGHTPGSVCFICEDAMFSGDTLFYSSRGRTDFYGGNELSMKKSLYKLQSIKTNYTVYCGHGQSTTLDREKKYNSYMIYNDVL